MGKRFLPHGVYAPLPVFFNDDDELDVEAYVRHAVYVAKPGVIPVISATMGEAAHLDRQERTRLIKATRSALDDNGLRQTPIVAGVGAPSTRETVALAKDAAAAGADFALVIAPGYFAAALRARPGAVRRFFVDVAGESPVPVVIYNYPLIAGGIDLSSDDVVDIATAAPNVCGVMLACGNVGKVSRISSLLPESFKTIAGFIDFLLPSVVVGSAGVISPLPNLVPEFAMTFWRSTQKLDTAADRERARRRQEQASLAEAEMLTGGVAGLKYLLNERFGYPAAPRLPLLPLDEGTAARLSGGKHLGALLAEQERGE
ncbi:hypothetical protein GE09DRAFT_1193779 [Coniochaeta sp. 2T2.1]|nr:hypothetical protein GE09DRAFT_1193779 [Coniochaeta sp. 2T2.1]